MSASEPLPSPPRSAPGLGAIARVALLGVATAILGPLQWLCLKTGLWRAGLVPRLWHRLAVRALGFHIRVDGTPAVDRPLLLVANHISWTDILVLGSCVEVVFVAKAETAHWPVIGQLTHLQRTIHVEREKRSRSGVQADALAERLRRGDVVALFPEGTTSDGTMLLPFNSSLFGAPGKLARETGQPVYIQPVAIAYTHAHGLPLGRRGRLLASWIGDQDFVPHLRQILARPAIDVTLRFGEPVAFMPGGDRKAIARDLETRVAELFGQAVHGRSR